MTGQPDRMFKIRRNSDGLFSTGGSYPTFAEGGKVYRKLAAVRSGVATYVRRYEAVKKRCLEMGTAPPKFLYADCQIIEYELQAVKTYPAVTPPKK